MVNSSGGTKISAKKLMLMPAMTGQRNNDEINSNRSEACRNYQQMAVCIAADLPPPPPSPMQCLGGGGASLGMHISIAPNSPQEIRATIQATIQNPRALL